MTKRSIITFLIAASVFPLSACGGEPTISLPTTTTQSPPTASLPAIPTDLGDPEQPTTAPPKTPSPLAGISPCSVMPPESVTQRGATGPGTEQKIAAARHCQWSVPKSDVFSVSFFDTIGIKDASIEGDGVKTTVTIGTGRHDAFQQPRRSTCAISIAISETSRVDIQFLLAAKDDPAIACPQAKTLADEVEPHLPPQVR